MKVSYNLRSPIPLNAGRLDTNLQKIALLPCGSSQPIQMAVLLNTTLYVNMRKGEIYGMQQFTGNKPVESVCLNCFEKVVGWTSDDGLIRIKCQRCGTVMVSKKISRTHIQVDVIAPKGQVALY